MIIDVQTNYFKKYCSPELLAQIVDYPSISHMWQDCVSKYGELVAIEDGDKYTYKAMDEDIALYRGLLTEKGLEKGDFVGMLVQNSYDFIKAYMAIQTMGCVAVLMPPHVEGEELLAHTRKFKMKTLVYDVDFESRMDYIRSENPTLPLVCASEKGDNTAPLVLCQPEDYSTIIFTGGTSGKNKGAILSQGGVMTGVKNGCYGFDEFFHQRYILVLPLTHVFGLIRNVLNPMYTGSYVYICRNPKDMFRTMGMVNPTIMILVPALAEMALTLTKQFKRVMWGNSLRYIVCGASAVPAHLITEYKEYGVDLFQGYGLTETSNLVSGNPENIAKPASVGPPYPGQQLRIENEELWIKGPHMMVGYYDEPEENEAAYTEGWFRTGDLVRVDEDGFLYITGRKKNIIVLSTGENISPEDLENTFCKLDILQDAMVYDEVVDGMHILVLEVYPRPMEKAKLKDADEYIMSELKQINAALPTHMRVSKIIIRSEDFERTPAMKKVRKITK